MDKIFIDKLKIYAHHGVFENETREGQYFYVSCEMEMDFSEAANDDDLNKTVDYGSVSDFICDFMTANNYSLIETVCKRMADEILLKYDLLSAVTITIFKPDAPIEHEFENVSVSCKRTRHKAYIAVGSNMGNSEEIISSAIKDIDESKYCSVLKKSELIVTKPYGNVNQDDFLNGAFAVETIMEPFELLNFLQKIELEYGRVRKEHWGPRTLDLDILFFDDMVIDSEKLSVPHIDMKNREFVLKPLCEIAPYKRHPIYGKTVMEIYEELKNNL